MKRQSRRKLTGWWPVGSLEKNVLTVARYMSCLKDSMVMWYDSLPFLLLQDQHIGGRWPGSIWRQDICKLHDRSPVWVFREGTELTHCDVQDLSQYWFGLWLVAWWHQAIIWTNVSYHKQGYLTFIRCYCLLEYQRTIQWRHNDRDGV